MVAETGGRQLTRKLCWDCKHLSASIIKMCSLRNGRICWELDSGQVSFDSYKLYKPARAPLYIQITSLVANKPSAKPPDSWYSRKLRFELYRFNSTTKHWEYIDAHSKVIYYHDRILLAKLSKFRRLSPEQFQEWKARIEQL